MSATTTESRRFPIGTVILVILMAIGLIVGIIRLVQGLGDTTNLSDTYPWGLWLGFDDMSGIALAAGSFTLAAVVHIFNLKKYRPVVRSAIMTGFVGYVVAILGLFLDLGRPFRIFNVLLYANTSSVLAKVAWVAVLYTGVMALLLLPLVFERTKNAKALQTMTKLTIPLVIVGVTLSIMHQAALGAVFLALPDKLHPLWYSPLLPVFFFVSAVALGLATEIFESTIISKAYKRPKHLDILSGLGRAIPYVLGFYLVLRVGELLIAGDFGLMFAGTLQSNMFLAENIIGVIVPLVLFALPNVRKSPAGLFWSATCVVVGTLLNRLNVTLIAPALPVGLPHLPQQVYFPHWMEFAVTIGLISMGILLYMLAVRFLPVFQED